LVDGIFLCKSEPSIPTSIRHNISVGLVAGLKSKEELHLVHLYVGLEIGGWYFQIVPKINN
jgi:hypothetical protein